MSHKTVKLNSAIIISSLGGGLFLEASGKAFVVLAHKRKLSFAVT